LPYGRTNLALAGLLVLIRT